MVVDSEHYFKSVLEHLLKHEALVSAASPLFEDKNQLDTGVAVVSSRQQLTVPTFHAAKCVQYSRSVCVKYYSRSSVANLR